MEFPSLNKVNELVFNNSRMLKINCPSLTTMTDLVLQNSDIGNRKLCYNSDINII
eukprot:Awhi_evm1s8715